jgi:hypothetical protein
MSEPYVKYARRHLKRWSRINLAVGSTESLPVPDENQDAVTSIFLFHELPPVLLVQSLDLLGLQRNRSIAPTEADIRMMAFGFRQFANFVNKGKCLPEIAKPEAPLDAVSFLQRLSFWGLRMKELSLLAREVEEFPRDREYRFCWQELRSCCLLSPHQDLVRST